MADKPIRWACMSPRSKHVQKRMLRHFWARHNTVYVSRNHEDVECMVGGTLVHITPLHFEQMLDDPTVTHVYIATPTGTRAKYVTDCLRAGKHVLVEKCSSTTAKEMQSHLQIADKNNVQFDVAAQCFNKLLAIQQNFPGAAKTRASFTLPMNACHDHLFWDVGFYPLITLLINLRTAEEVSETIRYWYENGIHYFEMAHGERRFLGEYSDVREYKNEICVDGHTIPGVFTFEPYKNLDTDPYGDSLRRMEEGINTGLIRDMARYYGMIAFFLAGSLKYRDLDKCVSD